MGELLDRVLQVRVLGDRRTARIEENTLEGNVIIKICTESARPRDHQPVSPAISSQPVIVFPSPSFPPRFGEAAMADPAMFFASITPEVETSTSSYAGILLWPVPQICRRVS
jgi:hypothetical protein